MKRHLIRSDGQEDLCFALCHLSNGEHRITGLINEVIYPEEGDRNIHGNVSFNSQYFDKVTQRALLENKGIVFIHSHPFPGWQNMSFDDFKAEEEMSPRVKVISDIPLIGMTVGSNGDWSARFWIKTKPKEYKPIWCESVRVVGRNISITFNENYYKTVNFGEEISRTISAWGNNKQKIISRLKIGIVGIGSVGSHIAEAVMRTGFQEIKLIDFDIIERKNLDRLPGISSKDIGYLKTDIFAQNLEELKLFPFQCVNSIPYSVFESNGIKAALDCDILFCCVDKPRARFVLNCIAYSSLIPVIDGGIDASFSEHKDNIDQARWRTFVASPQRRCKKCMGQYKPEDVALEQSGLLEDPKYIKGLPKDHFINRGENVYGFSLGLAGLQFQQLLSYILKPKNVVYGPKEMDFITGNIDFKFSFQCDHDCEFNDMIGLGDLITDSLIDNFPLAEEIRGKALAIENGNQKQVGTSKLFRIYNIIKRIRNLHLFRFHQKKTKNQCHP
ncbi:MAG: ThiF family adenylyltransferase [Bacteroidales bacterium]